MDHSLDVVGCGSVGLRDRHDLCVGGMCGVKSEVEEVG